MFNLRKPHDEKMWREVREVFEKVTTHERLIKIIHQFMTQPNKSLNVHAAPVAPKAMNYSRTESLTYRIAIVICHHNLGHFAFYTDCFDELSINIDEPLMNWLKSLLLQLEKPSFRRSSFSNCSSSVSSSASSIFLCSSF